jgi:hypothetical protein
MDLRPCGCGEARFDRASSVVELPGGELASRYAGDCARCGSSRESIFRLPSSASLTALDGSIYTREPGRFLAVRLAAVKEAYRTSSAVRLTDRRSVCSSALPFLLAAVLHCQCC